MSFQSVAELTGLLNRSENSLNQHLKLKHKDFWTKMKEIELSGASTNGVEGKQLEGVEEGLMTEHGEVKESSE